jgi:putative transposase
MNAALELGDSAGKAVACRALGVPRATLYRRMLPAVPLRVRPTPARALCADERQTVLDHLHSERFSDKAPAEVFATLLDEDIYLCSIRTMHRILAENGELKERRNQLRHPQYKKPELLATGPNQICSWDITKLLGPAKWTYFHLYVILDIFSRYVVGWMVAPRETAELAKRLIAETCAKQGIVAGELTIHADRGTSMTSKPVALLMADLGVTKTHSRPHVSDDNPYSESQFKTLKPGSPRTGLRPWGGSTGPSSLSVSDLSRTHLLLDRRSLPGITKNTITAGSPC